jgi:allantoicase
MKTTPTSLNTKLNLADASAGARVLFATDEFFAVADNAIQPTEPTFDPNLYDEYGKVMDGWESRRRRTEGHDWCLIQLAYRKGTIAEIEVDTAYFTGNHAPHISIQGIEIPTHDHPFRSLTELFRNNRKGGGVKGTCASESAIQTAEDACISAGTWVEILPMTKLQPGYPETRRHHFSSSTTTPITHVRLNIYPDGGVARLRLWGNVSINFAKDLKDKYLDLACASNGGKGIECSNQHYGGPDNLLKPTEGVDMRDGWETARHPNRPSIIQKDPATGLVQTQLMDWCIIRLGAVTDHIDKLVIDTSHFKGNYPESCNVEGCYYNPSSSNDNYGSINDINWFPILNRTRLTAHAHHIYEQQQLAVDIRKVSHLRLSIFPDGGISRLRVFGIAIEAIQQCPKTKLVPTRSHL